MGKGSKSCTYQATICVYSSLTTEIVPGCASNGTCLCLEEQWCLAAGKKAIGMGLVKDDNAIFKVALPCCSMGLIKPKVCVAGSGECLCVKSAGSLPFNDAFVPSPMCTICFIQCLGPGGAGILKEPPAFTAPGDAPVAAAPVADMER